MQPNGYTSRFLLASLLSAALAGCASQTAEESADDQSDSTAAQTDIVPEPAAPTALPAEPSSQASAEAEMEQTAAAGTPAPAVVSAPGETAAKTEPETAEPADQPAEKVAGGESAETKPAADGETQSADAAGRKPVKVTLGDPSLTAGIPGQGPLTVEEIQAWLDDPSNHEVLEISLPLGLSQGANQIRGLDDNPLTRAKIELGRQLYFDKRLSADFTVSCASCHDPDEGYTRHTQFGVGIESQQGGRNSPVSYNRIMSGEQFWDGRAASLEAQAKGPIANPIEMGNTHEACEQCLGGIEGYRLQLERIFEDGVTIDNIANAIASFERVIVTGPSPFDYYEQLRPYLENFAPEDLELLKEDDPEIYARYEAAKQASEAHPMSESAQRGRELFFSERVNCAACHVGANLTDEKYHNLGVGMDQEEPDLGRYEVTGEEKDRGAFKTPTIRNVALSAPYMHDGSQETLEEVVEWYNKGGHPNSYLDEKIKKLDLNDQEKQDLVAFMNACTGEFPEVQTERLPK